MGFFVPLVVGQIDVGPSITMPKPTCPQAVPFLGAIEMKALDQPDFQTNRASGKAKSHIQLTWFNARWGDIKCAANSARRRSPTHSIFKSRARAEDKRLALKCTRQTSRTPLRFSVKTCQRSSP